MNQKFLLKLLKAKQLKRDINGINLYNFILIYKENIYNKLTTYSVILCTNILKLMYNFTYA